MDFASCNVVESLAVSRCDRFQEYEHVSKYCKAVRVRFIEKMVILLKIAGLERDLVRIVAEWLRKRVCTE